jgi:nitrate reductase NapAB chaperone NapD
MEERPNLVNLYTDENRIVIEYLSTPLKEGEIEKLLDEILDAEMPTEQAATKLSQIILSLAYEDIKDIAEILNSIPKISFEIKTENDKIKFIINYDSNDEKSEKFARLIAISIASLPQWINTRFSLETEKLLDKIKEDKRESL